MKSRACHVKFVAELKELCCVQNLLSLLEIEGLDLIFSLIFSLTFPLSFLKRINKDMMQENCCFIFCCSGFKRYMSIFKKKRLEYLSTCLCNLNYNKAGLYLTISCFLQLFLGFFRINVYSRNKVFESL